MATLVLRNVKGSPLTNTEVDNNFSNLNSDVNVINSNIGILANLTTTAKSNIVSAINEIAGESTSNVTITGGTIIGVSNVTVAGNIVSGDSLTVSNTITAANIVSTGNVFGTYFLGNGSLLTGISVDSTRIISANSAVTILGANGNISANVSGTQVVLFGKDGVSTANIQVLGNITANVTKTSNLQDSTGRTLRILDESNVVIWGG